MYQHMGLCIKLFKHVYNFNTVFFKEYNYIFNNNSFYNY